jgi:hypothetical protein
MDKSHGKEAEEMVRDCNSSMHAASTNGVSKCSQDTQLCNTAISFAHSRTCAFNAIVTIPSGSPKKGANYVERVLKRCFLPRKCEGR